MTGTDDFVPDAFVIRTTDKDGKSYGGFSWPREIGALVEAPDWDPENGAEPGDKCGCGLHGLLDGVGDWSLLSSAHDALWWIVGVKRAECVDLDGKVKYPRGTVVYFGGANGALNTIAKEWKRIAQEAGESKEATVTAGNSAHANTAGNYAHANTAGYSAHANTAGDSAHANTAGNYAHAATKGVNAVAVALGKRGRAKAGQGGALCLVSWGQGNIAAIRASKVGENGIKPDTWYELSSDGDFVEVEEDE